MELICSFLVMYKTDVLDVTSVSCTFPFFIFLPFSINGPFYWYWFDHIDVIINTKNFYFY